MRVLMVATMLLMSSALVPSFAQEEERSSVPPQMAPVQPERSPQQSEQAREQDRKSAERVQIDRDWRAQQRDGDRMGQSRMGRMNDRDDSDHRTVGRNWQMQRDDGRGYDEDRPRARVKICTEYENGDEFCRYRN